MPTLASPIRVALPRRPAGGARALLRDLERPLPSLYWTDLLASAGLGWTAFIFGCIAITDGAFGFAAVAGVVAGLALYRAAMFIHELSHLRSGSLPGFTVVWNVLVLYLTLGFRQFKRAG